MFYIFLKYFHLSTLTFSFLLSSEQIIQTYRFANKTSDQNNIHDKIF